MPGPLVWCGGVLVIGAAIFVTVLEIRSKPVEEDSVIGSEEMEAGLLNPEIM